MRVIFGGGWGGNSSLSLPRKILRIVDLAQIQNVTLHHPAAANAPVLNDAESPVILAVPPGNLRVQTHDGCGLSPQSASGKYPWSALQPFRSAHHRNINAFPPEKIQNHHQ